MKTKAERIRSIHAIMDSWGFDPPLMSDPPPVYLRKLDEFMIWVDGKLRENTKPHE